MDLNSLAYKCVASEAIQSKVYGVFQMPRIAYVLLLILTAGCDSGRPGSRSGKTAERFPKTVEATSNEDRERTISKPADSVQLGLQDANAYVNRGNERLAKDEHDLAIKDYDEAIRLDPKNVLAYVGRGGARLNKDEYDLAIKDYDEAIRLDPKNAMAYFSRGGAHNEQGDHDLAIKDYDVAIQIQPEFTMAYCLRGAARQANADYKNAAHDYEKAIKVNPEHGLACYFLARLRATCPESQCRNGVEAVRLATKICEMSMWESVGCLDALAAAYAESGKFEQAVEWQTKCIELSDTNKPDVDDNKAVLRERLALYQQGIPYRESPSDWKKSVKGSQLHPK